MNSMLDIIHQTKNKIYQTIFDLWENSEFQFLQNLTSDQRGRWGEDFIVNLIKRHTNLSCEWSGDNNTSHGDGSIYDILINLFRTEVKTATVGFNRKKNKPTNTWQHENIYEKNVWDKLILLDIEPNGFYITVLKHDEMVFGDDKHPILGKKSTKHLSAWKFDSSKASLSRGIKNGITIYIGVDCSDTTDLEIFLKKHFGK